MTQTRPDPPPGAGVALKPAAAWVLAAGAGAALEGLAEVFGLNKSASVFFAGVGDGLTADAAAAFVLRPRFPAGEGDASVAAAGEAEVAASLAAFFLCARCVGDSAGDGDCPLTIHTATSPVISKKTRCFVFMDPSLSKRRRNE